MTSNQEWYREARSLERDGMAAVLTLGVSGNDPAARGKRMTRASAVDAGWSAAIDRAYEDARITGSLHDPWVAKPLGLDIVIRARGDLEKALQDPEVRAAVAVDLDLHGYTYEINNEDGWREEYQPDRSHTPEGRAEIDRRLDEIARELGVKPPPPLPAERPAAPERDLERSEQRPRMALRPPDTTTRPRPTDHAMGAPGRDTMSPGAPF